MPQLSGRVPAASSICPAWAFPQYDSPVGLVFVTIALFALGSLVRSAHALPQEISTLTKEQRLDLPYSKENIKVLYILKIEIVHCPT